MNIVGIRAQLIYWALGLGREHKQSEDERMVMSGSNPGLNEQNTNQKGGSRKNISSDMIITAQTYTPAITVTFQEAPMTRTCIINV